MEYRLDALHSFLPIFFAITEDRCTDPAFPGRLAAARTKFQLYCTRDEIDAYERLIATISACDNGAYTKAVADLARLAREGIRGELGLAPYPYPTRRPEQQRTVKPGLES
jgi:hypothetical protein